MTPPVDPDFDFRGAWLSSRQAQHYVTCKSLKSYYQWKTRHGIIARNNGSVAKADLDRELARRKPRRVMHARSLANLGPRRSAVA